MGTESTPPYKPDLRGIPSHAAHELLDGDGLSGIAREQGRRREIEDPEHRPKAEQLFPVDRIAILASGSGSTFEFLVEAVQRGDIAAERVVMITNNPDAGVIERAERLGIAHAVIAWDAETDPEEHDHQLARALVDQEVGLVVLAGYMREIGDAVLDIYENRIINTHPAILEQDPAQRRYGGRGMYGRYVHEAVFQSGETVSGATVHIVTKEIDGGPILRQARGSISEARSAEDVAAWVQGLEKPLLASVVKDIVDGTLELPKSS